MRYNPVTASTKLEKLPVGKELVNERTCIVSRKCFAADEMIRFVAGPDGAIVPDLRRNLPGRGVWVLAGHEFVDKAAAKNLFARGLKKNVSVSSLLANEVDALLERSALAGMGFARKAGQCFTGAGKVDGALRTGKAQAIVHAGNAADDGIRKLAGAVYASGQGGNMVKVFKLFDSDQMGLALGGTNVVHAALIRGGAADSFIKRAETLVRYRGGSPETGEDRLSTDSGFSKDVCKV